MKHVKKLLVAAIAILTLVCVLAFAACSNWPASYEFTGQLKSDTGSADLELVLAEDGSLTMEGSAVGGVAGGKWSGTWEQNSDGTVTVTFADAESEEMDPAPMYGMSLNDQDVDLGGMGGLTITSTIDDNDINTLEVIILVSLGGGFTMPFTGELTQTVAAE